MKINECFKVDISIQGFPPLVDSNKKTIKRIDAGRWYSIGDPAWVVADPFLFVHRGRVFCFYEDLRFYHYLGVIKMISSNDLIHWTKPVVITHEPDCHFSYPFVFEDNGQVYMMPETGDQHNIRLYKADNDELTSFSLYRVIMKRDDIPSDMVYDFADSCIHKKDGKYYLFTSIKTVDQYYLYLYMADNLEGPYTEHPCSPIVTGDKLGRCAGSLLQYDCHLYRYAQDCSESYGEQVHLIEIDELTPTSYREHVVQENILPTNLPFYRKGGHQVNFANFKGKVLVATDAKCDRTFVLERIVGKILRMIKVKSKIAKRSGVTK